MSASTSASAVLSSSSAFLELRDLLAVSEDVRDCPGFVFDRTERADVVESATLSVGPDLLKGYRLLLGDTVIDGPLSLIRDLDRMTPLPHPLVVRLAEHPLPNLGVANSGRRVEQVPPVGVENADLGGNVVEYSPILLELVDQIRGQTFAGHSSSSKVG